MSIIPFELIYQIFDKCFIKPHKQIINKQKLNIKLPVIKNKLLSSLILRLLYDKIYIYMENYIKLTDTNKLFVKKLCVYDYYRKNYIGDNLKYNFNTLLFNHLNDLVMFNNKYRDKISYLILNNHLFKKQEILKLKHFSISNNIGYTLDTIILLFNNFKLLCYLYSFRLYINVINIELLKSFLDNCIYFKKLHRLSFCVNIITFDMLKLMYKNIKLSSYNLFKTNLSHLTLSNNNINDNLLESVIKLLKLFGNLKVLNLSHNKLTIDGFFKLLDGLEDELFLPKTEKIDITHNIIGITSKFKKIRNGKLIFILSHN